MVVGFAIYFNFLCCRSGCCAWLCNAWCCCKGCLVKILCCCNICKFKDACCPAIGPESAAKATCCCFFTKHDTACCHNGIFAKRSDNDRKWKQPRAAAFIVFLTCFSVSSTLSAGRQTGRQAGRQAGRQGSHATQSLDSASHSSFCDGTTVFDSESHPFTCVPPPNS